MIYREVGILQQSDVAGIGGAALIKCQAWSSHKGKSVQFGPAMSLAIVCSRGTCKCSKDLVIRVVALY